MLKSIFIITSLLLVDCMVFAQVSISADNSAADNSAMLDVKSTSKGMLIPRMTQSEIEAIVNPANGMVVFCTTSNKFFAYLLNLNQWKEIAYGSSIINPGGGWSCGDPLAIYHNAAGGVAPSDITLFYGTVSNIPGEPAKCWITSNLGTDHQATAVDDAAESSAGWYWQFNRRQGYKYDGTRIPNSTWINSIDENVNWQTANDPCALELGIDWRLPTTSEWTNVDASGGWTDWNGPWSSGLVLHAAGYLNYSSGLLYDRGSNGYCWSNQQQSTTNGWNLHLFSSSSGMFSYNKAFGFSIRCLRE
jgi:hypothetical protein